MGLIGLIMACFGGLQGILIGLTKSTDHPSMALLFVFMELLRRLQEPKPGAARDKEIYNVVTRTRLVRELVKSFELGGPPTL